MQVRKSLKLALTALGVISVSPFLLSYANAGFEWVAPTQESKPALPKEMKMPAEPMQRPVIKESIPAVQQQPSMQHKSMQNPTSMTKPENASTENVPTNKSNFAANPAPLSPKDYSEPELTKEDKVVDLKPIPLTNVQYDQSKQRPMSTPKNQNIASPAPAVTAPVTVAKSAQQQPKQEMKPQPHSASFKEAIKRKVNEKFPPVFGFGSDVPLALALQQIVPANYSYAFGKGVNPGEKVSWQSGERWDDVLIAALDGSSMQARLQGQTIVVSNIPQGFSPQMAQPMKAPMQTQAQSKKLELEPMALQNPEPMPVATAQPRRSAIVDPKSTASSMPKQANLATPQSEINPFPLGRNYEPVRDWKASKGESLKSVLSRWSRKNKIQMVWGASYDYTVNNDMALKGTMSQALAMLFNHGLGPNAAKPATKLLSKGEPGQGRATLVVQDRTRPNNAS